MVQLNVNGGQLPTEIVDEYAPLPPGQYKALLVDVLEKDGGAHAFEIHITEGEFQGRKHFEWVNFNETRENMQWKRDKDLQFLGSLVNATGSSQQFATNPDTAHLVNKPFVLGLKIHQGKPYEKDGVMVTPNPRNQITDILPISNVQTAAVAPQQVQQNPAPTQASPEAAAAPAGNAAPWG